MNGDQNPEDVMNILIASDAHLGYLENDSERGNDSFIAFEEILSLASEHHVDFILLGGDLFDHSKQSTSCWLKTTKLIQRYCFGDKPVAIEILSDQKENFGRCVNYEDPNLNISYPIFSIHGNHDDPVGQESLSSLDILSSFGLINYFGKWTDYSEVKMKPVLLKKGQTHLALYGLSFLKDHRLSRLFKEGKIEMAQVGDGNDWFNLLAIHQNRADRGHLCYIPEGVLPSFLDFVLWGHEHDCRIHPEENVEKGFYVCQPGSSVATSLSVGESLPKHCGLLQIHKKEFMLTPIQLQTVRPFIFKTVVLSEVDLGHSTIDENKIVQDHLKQKIYEAIDESKKLLSGHPKQPKLPLIRLNVFYERDSQDFNRVRFLQQFTNTVASCKDILMMKREKRLQDRKIDPANIDHEYIEGLVKSIDEDSINVETLLEKYYRDQPPDKQLTVLSVKAMNEAVKDFTSKLNDESFKKVFKMHKDKYMEFLMKSNAETENEVHDQILLCKEELDNMDEISIKGIINSTSIQREKTKKNHCKTSINITSSDDDMEVATKLSGPPPKGRGRGRVSRGARVPRGAAPNTTNKLDTSMSSTRSSGRTANKADVSSWVSVNDFLSRRKGKINKPIQIDESDSD